MAAQRTSQLSLQLREAQVVVYGREQIDERTEILGDPLVQTPAVLGSRKNPSTGVVAGLWSTHTKKN